MTELYVVGGRQKSGATPFKTDEWHHYEAGVVCAVDLATGSVSPRVEYVSPPEACAAEDDPSIVFKSATLVGDRLYVPTQTEVLIYEVPSFQRVGYVSIPPFNDVHHVRPTPDGTLLVANTGLDMVLEVDRRGAVRREWGVLPGDPWGRFARDTDYRKVLTTKPHQSHPNFVFFLAGETWVTRCIQGDAVCLTADRPPIKVAKRPIHDGVVHGKHLYFTSVDGCVIKVDGVSGRVRRRYDLNAIAGSAVPLGWCRGLRVLDDDQVVVGFSRLRPSNWKLGVQRLKHRLGGDGRGLLPTRLVGFDLKAKRVLWEHDLEPAGLNAVFSLHAPELEPDQHRAVQQKVSRGRNDSGARGGSRGSGGARGGVSHGHASCSPAPATRRPAFGAGIGGSLKRAALGAAALVGALLVADCGGEMVDMLVADPAMPTLEEVSAEERRRLGERRIFFGHQSVGGNLLDGVRDLMADQPELQINIVQSADGSDMAAPGLYHALVGRNGEPASKLADFERIVGAGLADAGVALLKYCYVDVTADTDPAALFAEYRTRVEALREAHPGITIVHVTLPLQADYGTLFHLRTVLRGRNTPYRRLNLLREQYNALLRAEYAGVEPVFDLAHYESLDPEGRVVAVRYKGRQVPVLAPQWTDDGGHLNAAGRRRMADAFLATLARI